MEFGKITKRRRDEEEYTNIRGRGRREAGDVMGIPAPQ